MLIDREFRIMNEYKFDPPATWANNPYAKLGKHGHLQSRQNHTKSELRDGIYKPQLTITKRIIRNVPQVTLKIQFSAPKLLWLNNFDELEESDFYRVVFALRRKLDEMGVWVKTETLINAYVSKIDYAKNVLLANGLLPYSILKEIQKSNITQRMDFNQTDFRNEGHSIKFRANSFEITGYDKIKDMEKAKISRKRAVEDDTIIQMNLFEKIEIKRKKQPLEVFRWEIRLNERPKIRKVLTTLGYTFEPTFKNLFQKTIAQKILLYYLDEIENKYPKILTLKDKTADGFIAQFCIDNPKAKIKDALLAFGYLKALEEISTRELRGLFGKYPVSSWYSLRQQMDGYNHAVNPIKPLQVVRDSINEFVSVKKESLF